MRVRALVALLSTEIFGIGMTLPEMPALKSLRGIGMSDSPELASRLAEKFDYTNTFYHQAPFFDATAPDEADTGRFDFVISSEVLEHVPPPVERAFTSLARVLKPHGALIMTTPYRIGSGTEEHFPDLHEYTLASPGGRTVLVNRRSDGTVEVFDNLMFHGGHGSTLEMRVFSEGSLRELLACAGFQSVRIATENFPEFGVEHAETWSLPIAARKLTAAPPPAELALHYREMYARAALLERQLTELKGDYDKFVAHHNQSHREMKTDLEARTEWARKMEADLAERTGWALALQRELAESGANHEKAARSAQDAWECVRALEKELDETRTRRAQLEARLWTRLGRKLGMMS